MRCRHWLFAALLAFGLSLGTDLYAADTSVASEGYLLEDLTTQRVLAEKESTHYFSPASNLKIFTAFSALKILGSDYQFKTQIFFNIHAIKQGVLNENVSLVFSGDPLLKTSDLRSLVASLKTHGVHRINGNVILVSDAFNDRPYGDGWPWDQLHICYSGPVNTINLDANCFLFHVFPAKKNYPLDIPASVQCSHRKPGEPCVVNNTRASDDPNCFLRFDHDHNQYTLSGCLSPRSGSVRMKLSIPDTTLYAKTLVAQQLKDMGIAVQGKVVMSKTAPAGMPVATHFSYPVKKLVRIMLKFSDDLVANALFKALGGYYYHAQGTWERGINAEKALLQKSLGFSPEALFIFDGSGESYYNAITPQQLMRLLIYIYKTPSLKSIIIPALPVNGMDGTMVGRLHDYPSIIHAKTGTWRDVSSLSGYILKYNVNWAFVVFVNGMTPRQRGDADQVDAWMRKILPPVAGPTKNTPKSGKSK